MLRKYFGGNKKCERREELFMKFKVIKGIFIKLIHIFVF